MDQNTILGNAVPKEIVFRIVDKRLHGMLPFFQCARQLDELTLCAAGAKMIDYAKYLHGPFRSARLQQRPR